jgi:hypothetical protein
MKTFCLQQEKSGRLFIDETLHDSCELVDQCEARTWREAKDKLAGD